MGQSNSTRKIKGGLAGIALCGVAILGGSRIMNEGSHYSPKTKNLSRSYEIKSELEDISAGDIVENPQLVECYRGLVAEKESIDSSPEFAREIDERYGKRVKRVLTGAGIGIGGFLGIILYMRRDGFLSEVFGSPKN